MLGRFAALVALGALVAAPLAHQQQAKADDHEVVIRLRHRVSAAG